MDGRPAFACVLMRLPPPPTPEVVDRDDRLADLAHRWLREPSVGLDTEFIRERTFYPRLGLIQVADSSGCYLVDMVAVGDSSPLAAVVRSPAVTKVFHSPGEDLEIFQHAFGFAPENLFDCQVAAMLCGLGGSLGYVHLVSSLFEVELAKGAQRSNWLRRPLSEEQVQYAGLDVAYLLPAHEELRARLVELERESWAEEEFCRLLVASAARLDPEWSYGRLRRPGMSRRQLAALRALCEWREARARGRDLPRGFVLKDETLIDLARRLPRSGQDLASVKGLGPRQARRYGPTLLDLVRGAATLPESELPERLDRSAGRSSSDLAEGLRELVARVAGDLDLPAEALVPRRTLEVWAARSLERGAWVWPGEIEGWRRSVLEPEVERAGLLESLRSGGRGRRSNRGRGRRAGATVPATGVGIRDAMRRVDAQGHTIDDLYGLFSETAPPAVVVPDDVVPEPQCSLLAHENHMTVTLEAYHGGAVDVVVLNRVRSDRYYARKILLRRNVESGGEAPSPGAGVVQFGIMLFDLRFASEEARLEILSESAPLGHILIRQRQLRRISTHSLLEIEPDAEMRHHFGLPEPRHGHETTVFGRLATIFCDDQPAVELLEVLPPGPTATAGSSGGSAT